MKQKFTSTIAGASIFITGVLLIGKGLGLIREVIFANYFGLSNEYDLYLVATVLPITINSIILYIAQNYFIPNYSSYNNKTESEAVEFTGFSIWLFFFCGLFIAVIFFVLSDIIFSIYLPESSAKSLESTINLFKIVLIGIPLFAASSVLAAFLQAKFEFRLPSISQLLLNVAMIILVFTLQNSIGVMAIAIGYVTGALLQLLLLLYFTRKDIKIFHIKFFTSKKYFRFFNSSLLIIIIIESLSQLFMLSDRYFYNMVEPGGIAALNYAIHLYILPLSIISLAISTAIFPSLSKSINDETGEAEKHLNNFFSINTVLFVPITIVLFYFSDLIVHLLYERGAFSIDDGIMTASVLKIYTLSLIFYSTYAVLNKLIYSKKLTSYLFFVALVSVSLKIVLNLIFVDNLKQNGLALGTTLSYISFFILSFAVVLFKIKLNNKVFFMKELLWGISNGLISLILSYWLALLIPANLIVVSGIIQILLFVIIFGINTFLTNHNSVVLLSNALITYKNSRQARIEV